MRNVFKTLGIILLLLAIYFVAQLIVSVLIMLSHLIPIIFSMVLSNNAIDMVVISEEIMAALVNYMQLILFLSILITMFFYYLVYRKRMAEVKLFCPLKRIFPLNFVSMIVLGLSINFMIEYVLALLSQIDVFHNLFNHYSEISNVLLGGSFIFSLLVTGIFAPIFEEILFRGLIFGELKKITSVKIAILIQALIFGVYHFNFIQSSYAVVIGVILGYVCYKTNSLLSSILLHITFNSISLIMIKFIPTAFLENNSTFILVAAIILFFVFGVVFIKNNKNVNPYAVLLDHRNDDLSDE